MPKMGRFGPKIVFQIFFQSNEPMVLNHLERGTNIDHQYYIDKFSIPISKNFHDQNIHRVRNA